MDGSTPIPQNIARSPHFINKSENRPEGDDDTIMQIARDINNSLDQNDEAREYVNPKNSRYFDFIPNDFKDPLIIMLIYIFLSLEPVKGFISTYVPHIRPDSSGTIGLNGIIIYSIIFAIIFYVIHKVLF